MITIKLERCLHCGEDLKDHRFVRVRASAYVCFSFNVAFFE